MQLARFPRRRYTGGPTPLEKLERLSEHLGGPAIYIKRDDRLALTGGGNKTRKLEFLVADALEKGADTLITCGGLQSNHCRLTLAAAVREGLRCRLVLEEHAPHRYDPGAGGNNLLFRLLGAEAIRVVEEGADLDAAMQEEADAVAAEGRTPYVIPMGGSNALGTLGYAACAQELLGQAFDDGLELDHVVCTTGSGGTHAGLLAGLTACGAGVSVTGISVSRPRAPQEARVRELARQAAELLGVAPQSDGAVSVLDDYVGPGYGYPTEAMVEAVRLVARLDGVLLDPVYTGKAMAGLIDRVRRGRFGPDETVVFLHTGGTPALEVYRPTLLAEAGAPAEAKATPSSGP